MWQIHIQVRVRNTFYLSALYSRLCSLVSCFSISPVTEAIERAIRNGVCISVYLDDFVGSHNDPDVLEAAYDDIRDTCVAARLVPNPAKLLAPRAAITAFNCDLTEGSVLVTTERVAKYYASTARTVETDAAFEEYRNLIASANKAAI